MDASIWVYSLVSVIIVSLISFIGVISLKMKMEGLRKAIFLFVSFSCGALFGDAFIHLLPEAARDAGGFGLGVSSAALAGVALFFVVEKFIHWHHCHQESTREHPHVFAYMNLVGDSVHNFIDGLVIGASYLAGIPIGIATTIAVVLHEIPQELGDFGVLVHGGFSVSKALLMNFLVSLTAVLGTIVAVSMDSYVPGMSAFLVPFAAGGFIYIAGSDLIPELHKETSPGKSAMQLAAFLFGMGLMYVLLLVG